MAADESMMPHLLLLDPWYLIMLQPQHNQDFGGRQTLILLSFTPSNNRDRELQVLHSHLSAAKSISRRQLLMNEVAQKMEYIN